MTEPIISDNTLKLAHNVIAAQTLTVGAAGFAEIAPIFAAALREITAELKLQLRQK